MGFEFLLAHPSIFIIIFTFTVVAIILIMWKKTKNRESDDEITCEMTEILDLGDPNGRHTSSNSIEYLATEPNESVNPNLKQIRNDITPDNLKTNSNIHSKSNMESNNQNDGLYANCGGNSSKFDLNSQIDAKFSKLKASSNTRNSSKFDQIDEEGVVYINTSKESKISEIERASKTGNKPQFGPNDGAMYINVLANHSRSAKNEKLASNVNTMSEFGPIIENEDDVFYANTVTRPEMPLIGPNSQYNLVQNDDLFGNPNKLTNESNSNFENDALYGNIQYRKLSNDSSNTKHNVKSQGYVDMAGIVNEITLRNNENKTKRKKKDTNSGAYKSLEFDDFDNLESLSFDQTMRVGDKNAYISINNERISYMNVGKNGLNDKKN